MKSQTTAPQDEGTFKDKVADILATNIHFSGQTGSYVVHGALDEIWKLHQQAAPSSAEEAVVWTVSAEQTPASREEVLALNRYNRMIQRSWEAHTDQDEEWFKENFPYWRPLPPLPTQIKGGTL